jgi:hypothetical protein
VARVWKHGGTAGILGFHTSTTRHASMGMDELSAGTRLSPSHDAPTSRWGIKGRGKMWLTHEVHLAVRQGSELGGKQAGGLKGEMGRRRQGGPVQRSGGAGTLSKRG